MDGGVGEHVEGADDGDSADEGEGEGALGALDLAGHLGDVGPAVVGPEGGDEGDHEAGDAAAGTGGGGDEVVPGAVAVGGEEAESGDDEDEQAFEPGEGELDVAGGFCTDEVEQGDSPGDGDGEDLGPEEAEGGGGLEDVEEDEGGEDAGESGGDGGERGGLGDGDPGPHVEEAGEVTIGFAEEGVFAAVAGPGGGDLGVGHGTREGEEATDDPDGVDGAGGADGGHHLAGDQEDAAADDDADDDRHGMGGGEGAGELGAGGSRERSWSGRHGLCAA